VRLSRRTANGRLYPFGLNLKASPNPFNSSATLRYELQVEGRISLTVYDTAGRLVSILVTDSVKLEHMKSPLTDRDWQVGFIWRGFRRGFQRSAKDCAA